MDILAARECFIEADSQDGRLDGFLENTQLEILDPALLDDLRGIDLLDEKGRFPYAGYLDNFEEASETWHELTFKVDRIPLGDALLLGKKIDELRRRVRITFDGPALRLKSSGELFGEVEILTVLQLYPDQASQFKQGDFLNFEKLPEPMRSSCADREDNFVRRLTDVSGQETQRAFNRAVKGYLLDLRGAGMRGAGMPWLDAARQEQLFQSIVRQVRFYKPTPLPERNAAVNRLEATLAYEALYFFPSIKDVLWGGAAASIQITPNSCGLDKFAQRNNAFAVYPYDGISLVAHGQYDPNNRALCLPLSAVDFEMIDSGKYSTMHEVGHALRQSYSRSSSLPFSCVRAKSEKEEMDSVVRFFVTLTRQEYADVFCNSDYGHGASPQFHGRHVDLDEETHSRLVELSNVGAHFPERVREILKKKPHWNGCRIAEVYANLDAFRALIRRIWGFHGHPQWAERIFALRDKFPDAL